MKGRSIDQKFTKELLDFLYRAQLHGYGSDRKPYSGIDGANALSYIEDDKGFGFVDIWYGGEPFRGIMMVRYKSIACWVMTYGGEIFPDVDKEPVCACLKAALSNLQQDSPWRGPAVLTHENGLRYVNRWSGDIAKFKGKEYIYQSGASRLYEAAYEGGFVDLR